MPAPAELQLAQAVIAETAIDEGSGAKPARTAEEERQVLATWELVSAAQGAVPTRSVCCTTTTWTWSSATSSSA